MTLLITVHVHGSVKSRFLAALKIWTHIICPSRNSIQPFRVYRNLMRTDLESIRKLISLLESFSRPNLLTCFLLFFPCLRSHSHVSIKPELSFHVWGALGVFLFRQLIDWLNKHLTTPLKEICRSEVRHSIGFFIFNLLFNLWGQNPNHKILTCLLTNFFC